MKPLKRYKYKPDYAIPPGNTILEVCESLHMTKKELAIRLDLTEQTINRILKGDQPISYNTANKLELVTGIRANFWNKLEANYREQLAKLNDQKQLEKDVKWLDKIPVTELVNGGYVKPEPNRAIQLREVLQFYGVSSVNSWNQIWKKPDGAARRYHWFETIPEIASAWIRCGEIEAQKMNCKDFDKKMALKSIAKIRELTKYDSEVFLPKLVQFCCEAGIAISLINKMEKVPWDGASKWLSPKRALIILNLRGKREDKFWFSFFHEMGHILHDSKKGLYIADGKEDPIEIKANNFAAETLIPSKFNPEIMNIKFKNDFIKLAVKLGISPGIVAARYQHLTGNWDKFNKLIKIVQWR